MDKVKSLYKRINLKALESDKNVFLIEARSWNTKESDAFKLSLYTKKIDYKKQP